MTSRSRRAASALSAGRQSHCKGDATKVIEAKGRYNGSRGCATGIMHIESGNVEPAEFARAVIPHGHQSMFTDPHEMRTMCWGWQDVDA